MPIELPALSRRRFIGGSLAFGVAFFCDQFVGAAEPEPDPDSWALISDTHLAADPAFISKGVNLTESLQTVVAEIAGLARPPAGTLINGDLAFDAGEPGDYARLIETLRPLRRAGQRVHLTLGNHDDREHFWEAFTAEKATARPVADHQMMMIRSLRANWFVLDSLEKVHSVPGRLGEAQLAWLSRALDENADRPALVMCHHNPDPAKALKDTPELLAILRPRKQVKAFFFGHTHNWDVQRDESGIHLINLPPTAHVFTPGRPRGWVYLQLQPAGARLEFRSLDRGHAAHGQLVDLPWRNG